MSNALAIRLRNATVSITPDARPIEKFRDLFPSFPVITTMRQPTLVLNPAKRLKNQAKMMEFKPTTTIRAVPLSLVAFATFSLH